MKAVLLTGLVAVSVIASQISCQHPPAPAKPAAGATPVIKVVALPQFSGDIRAIDQTKNTVTVKVLLKQRVFEVAPGCEIVAQTKSPARRGEQATLADLRVGDAVDVTYLEAGKVLVAHRIIVKGITADEKEAARADEHLEKILNPNPSERAAY